MKIRVRDREQRKALAVARHYKSKGYVVRSQHGRFMRTPKIAGVRPDIVAQKGKNTVIVEVKSNASLQGSFRNLTKLSKWVKDKPNYRFDIV